MDTPKLNDVANVLQALVKPSGSPQIFTLSLTQFKELYQQVYKVRGDTKVDIVLNGTWAFVQFSELCNHRIRVLPDNIFNPIKKSLKFHLYIEKKDFEVAYLSANFFGQDKYITNWRFFIEEIQVNGIKTLIVILFSAFFFDSTSVSSPNIVRSANDILIAISSIFFSIFLVFTVSQNLPLDNPKLFRAGLIHRFIQIDTKVAYLAIFALGVSAINRLLSENLLINIPQTKFWPGTVIDLSTFIIWSTSLAIALIYVSLITVVQYYFKRIEYRFETEMSKKLLDEAFSTKDSK